MENDYVIWMHDIVENACGLQQMFGYDDDYLLDMGVPILESWPEGVFLEMNAREPDDTLLSDALFNVSSYLVVSNSLKEIIKNENLEDLELLPVGIQDHKGNIIPEKYFILNFTKHHPCLDLVRSNAKMSAIISTEVMAVEGLFLKDTELVKDLKMFRLKGFGKPTIVHRDLANLLDKTGLTGFKWTELSKMKGIIW